MKSSSFVRFPTADSLMPMTRSMFRVSPSVTTAAATASLITASTAGQMSPGAGESRPLSWAFTAVSMRPFHSSSPNGNGSFLVPLFSKRFNSTQADAAKSSETLYYVFRTDDNGITTRLGEVFFGQAQAEAFAKEMGSKGLKNHYYSEEVAVEREVLTSRRSSTDKTPTTADNMAGPPTTPAYGGHAVVTDGFSETLSHISLGHDVGNPLRDIEKGDVEGDTQLAARYERTLFEVWRIDTNGNSLKTEPVYEDQAKADAMVDELRSHGHKQHYYVEVVKVRDGRGVAAQKQQNEDDGED